MKRCIVLKLPDQREIFTHEKYHHTLLEFSKVFDVKISIVEAESPVLLHPKEIAKIFCDHSQPDSNECNYKVLHQISTTAIGAREKMLQNVIDVRSYIENQFREGQVVRIKELHHRFQKHNIAVSTLYRHVSYVRDKLELEGKKVIKVVVGSYRVA
jgi:hypothetical protein